MRPLGHATRRYRLHKSKIGILGFKYLKLLDPEINWSYDEDVILIPLIDIF